ncbi:MAG: hypothetical protein Q9184_003725 [Pyrenodesmia sp. 2 TL-2023]
MGNILHLPRELLDVITEQCQLKDLGNLSASCTTLRQVTIPQLYRNVKFLYGRFGDSTKLHLFVASILRYPERSRYVKRLEVSGTLYPPNTESFSRLDNDGLKLARCILVPERLERASQMLYELESESECSFDAALALVLLLLHELRVVQLNVRVGPYDRNRGLLHVSAALKDLLEPRSGKQPRGLQFLEEINYFTHPESMSVDAALPLIDAILLFNPPNIKLLQARAVEDVSVTHRAMSPPFRPSITSLSLKQSCVRADTLRKLLKATPNLRTLDYEYCCNFDSSLTPVECPVLDCNALRHVLDEVSASIESLALSINFQSEDVWDDQINTDSDGNLAWGISGSLGPMNHFLKLRYLKAPLVMLAGMEPLTSSLLEHWLPEDLCELCCSNELSQLYNFGWEYSDILRQMLPLIRNRSGRLQKLHLDAQYSDISFLWWPQIRTAIRATCDDAGVAYNEIEHPFAHR